MYVHMCVHTCICTHMMLEHVCVSMDTHVMAHLWMSKHNMPESDKNTTYANLKLYCTIAVTFLLLLSKGRKILYVLSCDHPEVRSHNHNYFNIKSNLFLSGLRTRTPHYGHRLKTLHLPGSPGILAS